MNKYIVAPEGCRWTEREAANHESAYSFECSWYNPKTRSISKAGEDPQTHNYIIDCLHRFYSGDYGEICEEDTAANNADLEAGDGHILARYKQAYKLNSDIYIEAMIYEPEKNDINYNYIMVMYPDER